MASKHLETLTETLRPTERKILYALVLTLGAYLLTRIYFIETATGNPLEGTYRVGFPLPLESVAGVGNIGGEMEETWVSGFFYPYLVINLIFWYIVSAVGDRVNVSLS